MAEKTIQENGTAEKNKAVEELKRDTVIASENTETSEEELSPWYYFFSQGCSWCKKSSPVVEQLIADGHDVLMLDLAEPDNQKLRDELFAEYNTRCGTPWFINAETGKGICGFREKDVLEVWLSGEDVPAPPRPTGPPPRVPFHGSTNKENIAWKKEYTTWVKGNKHLGDAWKSKQKSADTILEAPRPYSDPPRPPLGPDMNGPAIDAWGEEFKIWQEKNSHLPNLAPIEKLVENFKNRIPGRNPDTLDTTKLSVPEANTQINSLGAKVQALEIKVDKIIAHFGIK